MILTILLFIFIVIPIFCTAISLVLGVLVNLYFLPALISIKFDEWREKAKLKNPNFF